MKFNLFDSLSLKVQNSDGINSVHSIPRIHISSLDKSFFFEKHQKQGYPLILTGASNTSIKWDLTSLCEQIGSQIFLIRQFGRERYQQDKRKWKSMGSGVESASMTFSEFASMISSGEAYEKDLYLAKFPLTDTPLAKDSLLKQTLEPLPLDRPVTDWNLWIGSAGHTTCLHYDPFDGVLVQLSGAKRLVLFPPSQLYNLYPFHVLNHFLYGSKRRAGYSQLYPDAIDLDTFPNAQQAQLQRYEVVLNAGECIFIPAGWWHEISTIGSGMVCSVNRFWHVYPTTRSLSLWSKWRIHLASVLALPHVAVAFLRAINSKDRLLKLAQLLQRI